MPTTSSVARLPSGERGTWRLGEREAENLVWKRPRAILRDEIPLDLPLPSEQTLHVDFRSA